MCFSKETNCLGASTTVNVIRGMQFPEKMKIGDLIPGDYISVYDFKNKKTKWDIVYYIRNNQLKEIPQISITTEDNDVIVGTKEHLIYVNTEDGFKRIRFDKVEKDMSLLKISTENTLAPVKINEIRDVHDLPISPTTPAGNLCLGNKRVLTSCWSHSEENAKKMDGFNIFSSIFTKILPASWSSKMTQVCYDNIIRPIIR